MSTLPQRPDQRRTPSVPLGPNAAPPGLLGQKSAVQMFGTPGGSPYVLHMMQAAGRLWVSSLSFTLSAGTGFTGGAVNVYARLITGSGILVAVVELVVNTAGQIANGQDGAPLGGITVLKGDTLTLDVNNGVAPANTTQRASGFINYSVP